MIYYKKVIKIVAVYLTINFKGCENYMNIDDIKNYLQKHLSEFRYAHSLRVAEEAKKLARIYYVDEEKAYLVGLVHDIAHEFNEKENLLWIKKYNLSNEYLEKSYKNILHSDIGALVAKELFLFDDDMCQAIKYHTIGNVKMNKFDKIIFIADKIGRKNLDVFMEKMKELTYQGNLDQALIMYFKKLSDDLKLKKLSMHPDSLKLIHLLNNNVK